MAADLLVALAIFVFFAIWGSWSWERRVRHMRASGTTSCLLRVVSGRVRGVSAAWRVETARIDPGLITTESGIAVPVDAVVGMPPGMLRGVRDGRRMDCVRLASGHATVDLAVPRELSEQIVAVLSGSLESWHGGLAESS